MKINLQTCLIALLITAVPALGASTGKNVESVKTTTSDKTVNLRTNPLGLASGSFSAEADFRLSDHWTLGPSVSYFKAEILFNTLKGWGFGARSNYYLTGTTFQDSWILGTTAGLSTIKVADSSNEASATGVFLQSLIGYQWVWDFGLNMQVAGGATWFSQGSTTVAANGATVDVPFYNGLKPALEFTAGYVF